MTLRNQFPTDSRFDIPIICRQEISWNGDTLVGIQNANARDADAHEKALHCFKDDKRIMAAYEHPERAFERISHYAVLVTPNYSLFSNMPVARQIDAVFRSRWVGAYWQSRGKEVVANVTWGMPDSYDFCFCGLEKRCVVAVSTMGAERTKQGFLNGYRAMCERVEPSEIWCYCRPFPEMSDSVTRVFPYEAQGRRKQAAPCDGQLSMLDGSQSEGDAQ